MKKTIVVLLACCLMVLAFAEEKPYRHGISLNAGGPSSIVHLEYQYHIIAKEKHQLETGLYYTQLASSVTTAFNLSLRLGYRLNLNQVFLHAYFARWMGVSYSSFPLFGLGAGVYL